MKVYVFRKYSTVYRDFFRLEKRRLAALGTGLSVEHIGSTAVSGLGGKNILDIAIGCREGLSKTKKALEGLGYEFRTGAGTKNRLFFRKDYVYRGKGLHVHVHLTRYNGKEWRGMLAFRDYLIGHRDKMLEYAEIKKRAAKTAHENGEIYRKLKKKFIDGIEKSATNRNRL